MNLEKFLNKTKKGMYGFEVHRLKTTYLEGMCYM